MKWLLRAWKYIKNTFTVPESGETHKVVEYVSRSDNKIREEIIIGFLTKFSENQNHQPKIFIQFLSSVLIVIIAYVFVYTNTIAPNGVTNMLYKSKNIHLADTAKKYENYHSIARDSIIKPNLTSALMLETGDIFSYSVKQLIAIYLFCQFVFIVLISMIINMGYGFRRDLRIIHNIRCKYLGETEYKEVFGDEQYTWVNKRW